MQKWERETLECKVENIDFPECSFKSIVSKLKPLEISASHDHMRALAKEIKP